MSDDYGRHLITQSAPEGLRAGTPVRVAETRGWRTPVAIAAAFLLGIGVGQLRPDSGTAPLPEATVVLAEAELPVAHPDEIPVRLVLLAPDATEVSVAGTFNDWDPSRFSLERSEDGLFHAVVHLPRGRHEYMFVVDGTHWRTDPTASLAVDDGFGNRNAVLEI